MDRVTVKRSRTGRKLLPQQSVHISLSMTKRKKLSVSLETKNSVDSLRNVPVTKVHGWRSKTHNQHRHHNSTNGVFSCFRAPLSARATLASIDCNCCVQPCKEAR